jgi:predicted anti-sigma-YlaC factor YlaD
MLTCEAAEALVARRLDGVLTPAERALLEAHAADCAACRACLEGGAEARRALALRKDAVVPAGFVARVSARIASDDSPSWLGAIDWRRWTEWALPVAVALVLVAAVVGSRGLVTAPSEAESAAPAAAAVEAWTWSGEIDVSAGGPVLGQDVTNEELLEVMLGTRAPESEGQGNGR